MSRARPAFRSVVSALWEAARARRQRRTTKPAPNPPPALARFARRKVDRGGGQQLTPAFPVGREFGVERAAFLFKLSSELAVPFRVCASIDDNEEEGEKEPDEQNHQTVCTPTTLGSVADVTHPSLLMRRVGCALTIG